MPSNPLREVTFSSGAERLIVTLIDLQNLVVRYRANGVEKTFSNPIRISGLSPSNATSSVLGVLGVGQAMFSAARTALNGVQRPGDAVGQTFYDVQIKVIRDNFAGDTADEDRLITTVLPV